MSVATAALWDRVADKLARETASRRLQENRAGISRLVRGLQAALTTAAGYSDPDLSPSGLEKRRAEMAAQARESSVPTLAQLRAQVSADLDTMQRWADQSRPRIADAPAAIMRAQIKWDQVRMRLEAGMPLSNVLATADQETLLAIREWAPSWLEVQSLSQAPSGLQGLAHEAPDTSHVARTVDDRLAEVAGGEFRESHRALRDAAVAAAGFEPLAEHVAGLIEGRHSDPLEAAVAAQLAAQEAGGDPSGQQEG